MFIDRVDIHEDEAHKFSAFASDIGLTAHELGTNGWPRTINTNAGNKMPFQFDYHVEADGDVVAVVYRQELGCISLRIFNE